MTPTKIALAVKYLIYDIYTDSMKPGGENYRAMVDRLSTEKAGEEDGREPEPDRDGA